VPDPNYFADDGKTPGLGTGAWAKILSEIEALREEQRVSAADLGAAVADTTRRAEEISRQASEGMRGELEAATQRLREEMAEVKRSSGSLETGVGETRAALVELVEYDRQRRQREEADREKQERLARAAKAAEIDRAAKVHHRSGRREEAIAALMEARTLDPESAEISSNLGAALLAAGRIHPAEEPLRRAVRLDDGLVTARSNLGAMLLLKGESEEAVKQLEEAVKRDPAHGPAWNSLGNARWVRGLYAAAIEAWHQAYKADPLLLEAARNLERQQEI
jgi:tetratricopeptide (TPR) repeat protein